jgi:RNA polymerase sigma-70 factor, ECF subfamily
MPIQSDNNTDLKIRAAVNDIYKKDSRRIFATLVRLISDFDLAEEVLQEAFAVAVEQWKVDGIPSNPRAWLVPTARFKALDTMRRQSRFDKTIAQHGEQLAPGSIEIEDLDEKSLNDDHLRAGLVAV